MAVSVSPLLFVLKSAEFGRVDHAIFPAFVMVLEVTSNGLLRKPDFFRWLVGGMAISIAVLGMILGAAKRRQAVLPRGEHFGDGLFFVEDGFGDSPLEGNLVVQISFELAVD